MEGATRMTRTFRGAAYLAAAAALGAGPLAGQAPQTSPVSVGVTGYGQYVYQLKDPSSAKQNNFDVTRAYVNVIGRFSGGVYTRLTADIFTATGLSNVTGSYSYRLKYLYAAWTPEHSSLTYRFGMTQTPWLDWEEALWDYRMQGTMVLDRNGYLTASDLGFAVDGKWNSDKVNFADDVVNGQGYHATSDGHKDVQGRVSVRVMDTDDSSRVGGLRVTVYAGVGKPNGGGTRNRFLGMVSYRSKQYTLAAESAVTQDSTGGVLKDGHVYSAFGVYHVPRSGVAVIARVDAVKQTVGGNRLTRYLAGASYQINPQPPAPLDRDYLNYQTPLVPADPGRSQLLFQAQFTF